MPNPFVYGGRIENPADFVGRKSELRAIFSALDTFSNGQAQHISVIGERRIGKSSLLYHVPQIYQRRLSNPEKFRFAFIDLDEPGCHTLSGLLKTILREFGISASNNVTLEQFANWIEKVHENDKHCPVVIMDEFEHLTARSDQFPNQVYETFRSLASRNTVAFLTASRMALPELIQKNSITSTFPNIFIQIQLQEWTDEETRQFLVRSITCNPPFKDQETAYLRKLGGRHPYKLQVAGSLIYLHKIDNDLVLDKKRIESQFHAQMIQAGLLK